MLTWTSLILWVCILLAQRFSANAFHLFQYHFVGRFRQQRLHCINDQLHDGVRIIAGCVSCNANRPQCWLNIMIGTGRHPCGFLYFGHICGNKTGQHRLHNNATFSILNGQILGEFIDKCLHSNTQLTQCPRTFISLSVLPLTQHTQLAWDSELWRPSMKCLW